MSTVAVPAQSMTLVDGTDNPISLMDWMSSFLKALKTFNDMVDKIATVNITLFPAGLSTLIQWPGSSLRASSMDYPLFRFQGPAISLSHQPCNLIYELQAIIDQANRDDSIRTLVSKMNEVYTFLTQAELNAIEFMKAIVERITRQTVECSYFIQTYCGNQKFRELA